LNDSVGTPQLQWRTHPTKGHCRCLHSGNGSYCSPLSLGSGFCTICLFRSIFS